jgi:inosine-uridine nucleoside N-ribohydrolase
MLLAFAAKPEELEILLISVTYGNVEVQRYITLTSQDGAY